MQQRQLGTNGFKVSEIGLGCWQLGGDWGQALNEANALAILSAAVENGVDFFDTADVYGAGRSEKLIGAFLRTCDQPIRVATKFGRSDAVYPNQYSEALLRQSVEGSLERLGVDRLDLLQLHCIPTQILRDGAVFNWLRRLKDEGLIRHFGASVETVEEGLICLEQEELLSLQVIFNIFRQKLVTDLLPQAQQKGVGIIVRLPLASGLLSGKFTQDSTFAANDHRHFNRDGQSFNVGETFAGLPFEKGVTLTNALAELKPENMSMAQFALRWILDHEAVSSIIPGASRPAQAAANASAADIRPLSAKKHQALRSFYHDSVREHIRGPY